MMLRGNLKGGRSAQVFSRQDLERLLQIEENPVLSIYLNTDPAQDPKASYRIWLKDALKRLEAHVDPDDQKRFRELAEQVQALVRETRPRGKAWVAFLGQRVEEQFDLRVPVENEVLWGRPGLTQLEWLLGEYHPYGVALVDSTRLRFFVVAMNEIQELESRRLEVDASGWREEGTQRGAAGVGGGDKRDAFAERVKAQTERFWREALEVFRSLQGTEGVEKWVIAGSKAVRERFLQTLGLEAEHVIGQATLPMTASPTQILEESLLIIQAHEREREEQLVKELLRRASTSERAGVGLAATLKALQEGRAERVIVNRRLDVEVRECAACGYVYEPSAEACPQCRSMNRKTTSLRSVLPLLLRKHGARLEIVRRPAADLLEPHGGIGALWRY